MKRGLRVLASALAGLLLSFAPLNPVARAEQELSVRLPVSISAEGTLPEAPQSYVVRMTANGAADPMPNAQQGGSFELTIDGCSDALFPAILYEGVGVYSYAIEQIAGTYPGCKYDARKYALKVSVTNAEDGGYDLAVALREEGKESKLDVAQFHNIYRSVPKPTTPPGTITPTGIFDAWQLYFVGSALLLVLSGVILYLLCRKRSNGNGAE